MIDETLDKLTTTTSNTLNTTTDTDSTTLAEEDNTNNMSHSPISTAAAEMVADLVAELALDGNNNADEIQSAKKKSEPGSSLPSSPSSAASSAGNAPQPTADEQLLYESIMAGTTGNANSPPSSSSGLPIVDEYFIATLMHKICPTRFTAQWLADFRTRCESSLLPLTTEVGSDQLGQRLFARLVDRKPEQYVQNVSELVLLLATEANNAAGSTTVAQPPSSSSQLSTDGEVVVGELRKYLSVPSARTVTTFNSIVLRLVKLVHGAIESDRGCFTFYQIFSNIFVGTNNEGLECNQDTDFGSKVMKELKILINSLASFDRNIGDVFSANQQQQQQQQQQQHQQQQQQRCREEQISGSSTTSGYGRCSTTTSPGMESLEGHGSPTIFGTGLSQANMAQLKHPIAMSLMSETTTPSTMVSADYTLGESSLLGNNNTFGLGGEDTLGELPPSLVSPSPLPSDLARIRFRNNSGYTSNGSGGSFTSPTLGAEFSLLKDNVVGEQQQQQQQQQENTTTTPGGSTLFNDFAGFTSGVVDPTDYAARPILGGAGAGGGNFSTLSGAKNQCYTITMNQQQQQQQQHGNMSKASSLVKGSLSAQLSPFSDDYLMSESPQAKAASAMNANDRLDKDHLYRLIIGQLLHDNHRAIANQLAVAEHIKSDGSLVTPNDRLHDLVSMAIKREIDLMTANSNTTRSRLHPSSSMNYMDSLKDGTGRDEHHLHVQQQQHQAKSMDSLNYSVGLKGADFYDRPSSMSGSFLTPSSGVGGDLFSPSSVTGNVPVAIVGQQKCLDVVDSSVAVLGGVTASAASADYGDIPLDSLTDLYDGSAVAASATGGGGNAAAAGVTEIYYGRTNSCSGGPQQPGTGGGNNKAAECLAMRSMSVTERCQLRSNKLLESPGVVKSGGLILNEAGLKNLNQLARLSATDGSLSQSNSTMTNSLIASANNAVGGGLYGRASSAMATLPNGGAGGAGGSDILGQTLQSGRMMLGAGGGVSSVVGAGNGSTHTTGNGKNHHVMEIRAKFGSLGATTGQFSSPHGFCLGMSDEIIIADTNNHRICIYDKAGSFKHSFGVPGKDEGQLWYPRKIAMICTSNVRGTVQNPYYVICDRGMERSRMQIFTRTGNFVRKIPIRYIDIVAGIAINAQGQIVAVDSVSPTVFIITEGGELTHWFDCSNHMREPSDIAIYKNDYYICDFKGHCVVVLTERGNFLRKIGMEGLTSFPNGIDISMRGDILVGDSHGNRFHVVVFNHEGKLLSEYECPYVKVSRCCGLKLTSEGYIVTLAKNNHHVLVLNTIVLYHG